MIDFGLLCIIIIIVGVPGDDYMRRRSYLRGSYIWNLDVVPTK